MLFTSVVVATGAWSSACSDELTDDEVQGLIRWVECEKCDDDDFAFVQDLGDRAADSLVAWLINGPPSDRMDAYRNRLVRNYRQIQTYAAARRQRPLDMSESDYVSLYADTYDVRYRHLSAYALVRLAGRRALPALDSASRVGLRPDVAHVVGMLRDSLSVP
jgi:hypothetical protein